VPLTQPWYLGLANIRGQLTGVELASYLHGQLPAPTASGQRDITLAPALKLCAVRVEAVLGLRYLADMVAQDDARRHRSGAASSSRIARAAAGTGSIWPNWCASPVFCR
jgi:twitching motility protein PilI